MADEEVHDELFTLTGKALLFDALAVSLGFLALLVSDLPILRHFGLMIAISITVACVTSLAVIPPLVRLLRPRFVYGG
jgi:predicted RND superfamily exporter protein